MNCRVIYNGSHTAVKTVFTSPLHVPTSDQNVELLRKPINNFIPISEFAIIYGSLVSATATFVDVVRLVVHSDAEEL